MTIRISPNWPNLYLIQNIYVTSNEQAGHMFLHFKSIIKVYIHPLVSNDSAYTKHHFDPVLHRQRAIYWANFLLFMYLATYSSQRYVENKCTMDNITGHLNDVCSCDNKLISL